MAVRALYDLPAPAKLNAFLHLVGRREDGYHLLQSAFVLIDWADTLHIERRDDGALHRHDLGAALPADDLCLRAARALQAAAACALGADIHIDKRVPWGAGMGGGSSDAATVLLALNRLWELRWSRSRLLELALRLGADVPFFVAGENAFVEGIGEQLTPLAWPAQRFEVLKPPVALATRDVFTHRLTEIRPATAILVGSFESDARRKLVAEASLAWVEGWGRNDLQPAAQALAPVVAQAAAALQQRHGNSRMTGSGSAVFARVAQKDGTEGVPEATKPPAWPEGWVHRMCRSLPEHPLRSWAD